MSKKCHFTVPFNKQHGKRPRTLFKSERRQLYHIYLLITVKAIKFEKVTLSYMQNLKTVC